MAKENKRGPKGGAKHQPGRGHDRKSAPHKKQRFQRRAGRKRLAKVAEARRQWAQWDRLSEEAKALRPELRPTLPRPQP